MKNTITIHKNSLQVLIALIYYLWQLCVRSIWFAFDFSANYVFYSLLIRILCKFSYILLLPHNFSCKMFKCKCSLYCYCAWMRVYVYVCLCECCWFKYFSQNLAPVAMLTSISTKWSILFSLDRSCRHSIAIYDFIFSSKIFFMCICVYILFSSAWELRKRFTQTANEFSVCCSTSEKFEFVLKDIGGALRMIRVEIETALLLHIN